MAEDLDAFSDKGLASVADPFHRVLLLSDCLDGNPWRYFALHAPEELFDAGLTAGLAEDVPLASTAAPM